MGTEKSLSDRSRVVHLIPTPPNAYHGLFVERDCNNSSRTTIGSMPVVAMALIEYEDGATQIDAVLVDWEEGFTLLGDLSNARGVCLAEELEEAKACHAEGQLTYRLAELKSMSDTVEKETVDDYDTRLGAALRDFLESRGIR